MDRIMGKRRLVLFHLQFAGPRGWEAFGSGEGSGESAMEKALEDLRALHGGTLPHGTYRLIAAGREGRWEYLESTRDEPGVLVRAR
jgi:hypothetical protein